MEILKSEKNRLSFVLEAPQSFVNALRRASNEISILAVDEMEITKNDSVLRDEMLAHRIGLVPLSSDKTFTLPEECSCDGKGCGKCTAELVLKAVGKTGGPCTVYASDLKSKTVKVVYPDMPLVILQPEQELELVAEARLGRGSRHAKYSPGLVYFKAYPKISISGCDACEACVKACPHAVLEQQGKKIVVKNLLECDLCEACVEECKKLGKSAIKVEGSKESFIFNIESWGQISAREIFIESSELIGKNLKNFEKEVDKIK